MEEKGAKGTLIFSVKVKPCSSMNKIIGMEGDTLEVKLNAPPVEGEANKALVDLLSESLGINKASVHIVRGLRSRNKLIRVCGLTKQEFMGRIGI